MSFKLSISSLLCAVILSGCGYKSLRHYSQEALGDNIYVDLKVNVVNLENSTELKDLLNKIIIARLQKNISSKSEADTIITATIESVNDISLATNNGFSTFYRANVRVSFKYKSKNGLTHTFRNLAYKDYAVSLQDPLITYQNRINAINKALVECTDKFLAQIANQGFDSES